MNLSVQMVGASIAAILLASCGFQIGPAHPERDGRIHLERQGYSESVIEAVVKRRTLDHDTFMRLISEDSLDVRFLVAQNQFIDAELLSQLTRDPSDFVRGGSALNPKLTREQIERLSRDKSHTTRLYVARNPVTPEEVLLRMHEQEDMDLFWFAMNPNCPESLKQKMREQNDERALSWLASTTNNESESDAPANGASPVTPPAETGVAPAEPHR